MSDVDVIGPDDEVPEADAADQHRSVDDAAPGLDTAYLSGAVDRDANEADVIEQAYVVPDEDDDWSDH